MLNRTSARWRAAKGLEEIFEREVIDPMIDFADPSQEWRRLFSELLGTFFLVLVACGGGVIGTPSRTRSAVPRRSPRPA